jgi:hypothetical protein
LEEDHKPWQTSDLECQGHQGISGGLLFLEQVLVPATQLGQYLPLVLPQGFDLGVRQAKAVAQCIELLC